MLNDAARRLEAGSYSARYETAEGELDVERVGGVTHFRLDVPREGETVKLEVFQYDPAGTLHFPRTVICGPDRTQVTRCLDATLAIIGDFVTDTAQPKDFHGIAFSSIFSRTRIGMPTPSHWRNLAGLAHSSLDLRRVDAGTSERLGMEDRVYVTAKVLTGVGEADCFGWFDSASDLDADHPRSAWCQHNGIWFTGKKDSRIVDLRPGPEHLSFPAEVEYPTYVAASTDHAGKLFLLTYPEYSAGFLEELRKAPTLP